MDNITDGALPPDTFRFLISEFMDTTTAAEREVQVAIVFQFENKKIKFCYPFKLPFELFKMGNPIFHYKSSKAL